MPLYEFVCSDCQSRTDVRATIAERDAGLTSSCGACGSDRVRRALPTVAVRRRSSTAAMAPTLPSGGGGGCGGGCACACGS